MSIPVPHFLTDHLTMSVPVSLFTARSLFYSPLPSIALCPLYSALPSMALCLFYSTLPSTALCPLYSLLYFSGPLPPIWPSFSFSALSPSMALCLIYGPLYPLRLSAPSTALCPFRALCPLYGPLTHLHTVLCLLFSPLSSLLSSVLCPLNGSPSPRWPFGPSTVWSSVPTLFT